jgi:transcriptional regulator with XRE-family HTH domain
MLPRMEHLAPKHNPTLIAFGQNITRTRSEMGLTLDQLAEKADLDPAYLSGIERGVNDPGVDIVFLIAAALGVSASKLAEGID